MAELPSGTVGFLFTDIEGSTKLLHALGDDYAVDLRDDPRLRQANGGSRNAPGPKSHQDSFESQSAQGQAGSALMPHAGAQRPRHPIPLRIWKCDRRPGARAGLAHPGGVPRGAAA